ncbi:MAG: hypothetical protein KC609_01760 [Myxococcales bacterium]|nr:hypothetical protein [Myxococcales bacterium]
MKLGEIEEGLERSVQLYPRFKRVKRPLTQLVSLMTGPARKQLAAALKARDRTAFLLGFRALTKGCNSCHKAADHSFIARREPTKTAFPNQTFEKGAKTPARTIDARRTRRR